MKIFVTGATGFLGYHIVKACVVLDYEVLCLKRHTSISTFDADLECKINWVNSDDCDWEFQVKCFQPDILIHCAWNGVSANERNSSRVQSKNIVLSEKLFHLVKYKQIIVLGSQEEYGQIDSLVDETHPLYPITEYAKAKISVCESLKEYAFRTNIEWQWIRVFSVYGEKQKKSWLIPSLIEKCLNPTIKEMATTKGEQIYSFLYSSDFANAIMSVIGATGKSGIYNISSTTPVKLKELFEIIKNKTKSKIEFLPTLPYREYQSMFIVGNSNKFKSAFGEYERTSLSQGLDNVINMI